MAARFKTIGLVVVSFCFGASVNLHRSLLLDATDGISDTPGVARALRREDEMETPFPAVPAVVRTRQEDLKHCREVVFTTQQAPTPEVVLHNTCDNPESGRFDVCRDLVAFTGMPMTDVRERMARVKHFHFEEEHAFWNPQSTEQLAWYYSTSQSYLFANAVHAARTRLLDKLQPVVHEPVLDYSGGVGNSVLYLAIHKGMTCQYFGIGLIEKAFTQFRVAKRNLGHMITFVSPWSDNESEWDFDPIRALPRDGTLGAILATDVLEHIPNYHIVVAAMVDSLKVGGVIIEQTPFAENAVAKGGGDAAADLRIHVHNGGVSMKTAMGDRMVYRDDEEYWEKIKDFSTASSAVREDE